MFKWKYILNICIALESVWNWKVCVCVCFATSGCQWNVVGGANAATIYPVRVFMLCTLFSFFLHVKFCI